MNSTHRRAGALVIVAIISLLSLRIALHIRLYQSGFEVFCADDCIRVEMASAWAKHPHFIMPQQGNPWLPFHSYLVGVGLMGWNHLLFAPRLVSIISGMLAIIFMYGLTQNVAAERGAAVLSVLLLTVNPAHLWLSSTPLSESFQFTALIAFLYCFTAYLKREKRRLLYLSATILALGSSIRYEVWAYALIFSLILIADAILAAARTGMNGGRLADHAIAALIPWIFPAFWIAANHALTGDAFHFIHVTKEFDAAWLGTVRSYREYARAFLIIDPFALVGGSAGLILLLVQRRNKPGVKSYAAFCLLPFLMFAFSQGGKPTWPRNYIRYLFSFLALTYPAFAYFLVAVSRSLRRKIPFIPIVLATGVVVMAAWHVYSAYIQQPLHLLLTVRGIKAGEKLAQLSAQDPSLAAGSILVEASSWKHNIVRVGAGTGVNIVRDRAQPRTDPSILKLGIPDVRRYIMKHNIKMIVLNSPELVDIARGKLMLEPLEKIGEFYLFPVPSGRWEEPRTPIAADPRQTDR